MSRFLTHFEFFKVKGFQVSTGGISLSSMCKSLIRFPNDSLALLKKVLIMNKMRVYRISVVSCHYFKKNNCEIMDS